MDELAWYHIAAESVARACEARRKGRSGWEKSRSPTKMGGHDGRQAPIR